MTDPAQFVVECRRMLEGYFGEPATAPERKLREAIDHIEQLNQRLRDEYNRGAKDADGNRLSQAAYQSALDAAYNAGGRMQRRLAWAMPASPVQPLHTLTASAPSEKEPDR